MEMIAMNPSAKVLMEETRVVKVAVVLAYVPTVTEDENCWKKERDVLVTVRDPCWFQTMSAS